MAGVGVVGTLIPLYNNLFYNIIFFYLLLILPVDFLEWPFLQFESITAVIYDLLYQFCFRGNSHKFVGETTFCWGSYRMTLQAGILG